jgi:hypothetical protein
MNPRPNPLERVLLGNGSSIQPVDPGAEFARQAEPLDRLAGDIQLVNRLMWARYDGPEWRLFQKVLAEYGVAVVHRWIQSGRIFQECARKGFGALLPRRRLDPDDALGIAGETVARAFVFFRNKVLIQASGIRIAAPPYARTSSGRASSTSRTSTNARSVASELLASVCIPRRARARSSTRGPRTSRDQMCGLSSRAR